MPQLQTFVDIPSPKVSIEHSHNILLLGSCFSTNIGKKLEALKFRAKTNPFGVIYNPASIAQSINILLKRNSFEAEDLNFNNGLWFSYYHHSSFSNVDKQTCLDEINKSLQTTKEHLLKSDYLFLTLGTAWAYRSKETSRIVANCHKIPAKEFDRVYLNPDEIYNTLSSSYKSLFEANRDIKIVLTVSPIRHWKDGAIENMRSKSSLILAIKELEKNLPNIYYFPVYEIFMDELRDYRFYASDMLHPSEFSIEYIWERFIDTFFNNKTTELVKEIEKLIKLFRHKPMNTEGENYKKFLENLKSKVSRIQSKHAFLDFSEELNKYFV